MLKTLTLIVILPLLSSCSFKPVNYNFTDNIADSPINVSKSLPNIRVANFIYEPHRNISQYETAVIGCPFCDPNGGREKYVFQQPIKQIIQTEAQNALDEVTVKNSDAICLLSAQIQFVGDEASVSGITHRVDATYTLSKGDSTYFVKRIVGNASPSVFDLIPITEMWARPVRDGIRQLVADANFLETIDQRCR